MQPTLHEGNRMNEDSESSTREGMAQGYSPWVQDKEDGCFSCRFFGIS